MRGRIGSADAGGPIADGLDAAAVEAEVTRNRWYWLLLLKRGPVRDQPREALDRLQAEHLAHLFTLRRRGLLTLFGPVVGAGTLRGIGVLIVASLAEAESLMADDPMVRAGRLRAEVRPWFTLPGATLPDPA